MRYLPILLDSRSGAVGAVVGELTAQYASSTGMTDPASITALAKVMSATAGLLTSNGAATAVNVAASMGANAAENNALAHGQAVAIKNNIKNCAGNMQCINDAVHNATLLSDSQGKSITQSSAQSAIAVLGSLLTDPTITLSPTNQQAIVNLTNKNASDYYVAPSNVPAIASASSSYAPLIQQSVVVGNSAYSPLTANCPLGCADSTAYALNNPQTNAYANAVNKNTVVNGIALGAAATGLAGGLAAGTALGVGLGYVSPGLTVAGYGANYAYTGHLPSAGNVIWDGANLLLTSKAPLTIGTQTSAAALGILGADSVPSVINRGINYANQLLKDYTSNPVPSK